MPSAVVPLALANAEASEVVSLRFDEVICSVELAATVKAPADVMVEILDIGAGHRRTDRAQHVLPQQRVDRVGQKIVERVADGVEGQREADRGATAAAAPAVTELLLVAAMVDQLVAVTLTEVLGVAVEVAGTLL